MARAVFATATRALFMALATMFVVAVLQSPLRADGRPMILPTDPVPLLIDGGQGQRSFTVEIARTARQQEQGLMFRQTMADDHGMLFAFDQNVPVAFWMKNTPMPLDLIFIGSDGRIRAIRRGEPFSTDIISPAHPVQFVLELKAGTAQKAGVSEGDKVRHPAIEAVRHSH
jgi:uncharacterized membrane protein (UPF0127 family)